MAADGLLNVDQVCAWLGVTKDWVYDQCEAGRFPHLKIGRHHLRFEPDAIREYIADARRGYRNDVLDAQPPPQRRHPVRPPPPPPAWDMWDVVDHYGEDVGQQISKARSSDPSFPEPDRFDGTARIPLWYPQTIAAYWLARTTPTTLEDTDSDPEPETVRPIVKPPRKRAPRRPRQKATIPPPGVRVRITGTNLGWTARVMLGQTEIGHRVTSDGVIETAAPIGANIDDVVVVGVDGHPTPVVTGVEAIGHMNG